MLPEFFANRSDPRRLHSVSASLSLCFNMKGTARGEAHNAKCDQRPCTEILQRIE